MEAAKDSKLFKMTLMLFLPNVVSDDHQHNVLCMKEIIMSYKKLFKIKKLGKNLVIVNKDKF
jgi:hypothetical protein